MNPLARALRWCLLLCAGLLGSAYLVASLHLFPVLGGDSAAHLTPVLNFKAGRGFESVAWSLTRDYDPTGQHRFLQYPPLFHLVVAGLIRQPTVQDLFVCLAGFAVVSLGLLVGLILRKRADGFTPGPLWLATACLSLFAASTWLYSFPLPGRPEALTTPLILLAALCFLPARPVYRPLIAGIFIGLIGAAQIANACLAGLLFSVYASVELPAGPRRFRDWLAQVSLAAAVSLLTFAACFLFSPHPFMETMRGIAVHLSRLPPRPYGVVEHLVFPAASGTFYGPFMLVLLAHFLWEYRGRLGWLGVLSLCAFLSVSCLLVARCHNLLALSPLLIALALHLLAGSDRSTLLPAARWRRGLIYAVYGGLFSLMSLGFARHVALFAAYRTHGVSYEEARAHLCELLAKTPGAPVLVDGGLWTLLDRFDHVYQRTTDVAADPDPTPDSEKPVLIVHQWYEHLNAPPTIPGYQLVWDDFVRGSSPRVLGVKVGLEMPGYAFAFYRPISP